MPSGDRGKEDQQVEYCRRMSTLLHVPCLSCLILSQATTVTGLTEVRAYGMAGWQPNCSSSIPSIQYPPTCTKPRRRSICWGSRQPHALPTRHECISRRAGLSEESNRASPPNPSKLAHPHAGRRMGGPPQDLKWHATPTLAPSFFFFGTLHLHCIDRHRAAACGLQER